MGPGSNVGHSAHFFTKWSYHLEKSHRLILLKFGIEHSEDHQFLETVVFWLSFAAIASILVYSVCLCKVYAKHNKQMQYVHNRYRRFSQFFPGMFHDARNSRRNSFQKEKDEKEKKLKAELQKVGYGPHIPLNCPNRKVRIATPSDGIHAKLAQDLTLAMFPSVRNVKCHERGLATRESKTHLISKQISKRIRTETLNSLSEGRRKRTESMNSGNGGYYI